MHKSTADAAAMALDDVHELTFADVGDACRDTDQAITAANRDLTLAGNLRPSAAVVATTSAQHLRPIAPPIPRSGLSQDAWRFPHGCMAD